MPLKSVSDRTQYQTALINPSTATRTAVVAAAGTGQKVVVHAVAALAAGANTLTIESATTAIFGAMALAANGGFVLPFSEVGWCKTNANEALNLSTSAAVATGFTVVYSIED